MWPLVAVEDRADLPDRLGPDHVARARSGARRQRRGREAKSGSCRSSLDQQQAALGEPPERRGPSRPIPDRMSSLSSHFPDSGQLALLPRDRRTGAGRAVEQRGRLRAHAEKTTTSNRSSAAGFLIDWSETVRNRQLVGRITNPLRSALRHVCMSAIRGSATVACDGRRRAPGRRWAGRQVRRVPPLRRRG
jgi:hypothetical protein